MLRDISPHSIFIEYGHARRCSRDHVRNSMLLLRMYLRRENAKLDRGEDPGKNGPTAAQQAAGLRYLI